MHFARVFSVQPVYLRPEAIAVEADLTRGLHTFSIVGLPDKAVEEARDRVSAAIKNSGFPSPKQSATKVTVSLAPADTKKEGPVFDLPIALSYLLAAEALAFDAKDKLFLGELALDGTLRPVRGALAAARFARAHGYRELYLPRENAEEAALVEGVTVYGAQSLREVVAHVSNTEPFALAEQKQTALASHIGTQCDIVDLGDIRGQETAKRGLMIAAAGRHNLVLYGPPGTGKTMLARAFAGLLPPLSLEEALEVTEIHSLAGTLEQTYLTEPPFRSPHHSASHVSIIGGGASPRPGEVTLAHRGVLFLDEFPEFERRAIDGLREPLENRTVSISRAKGTVTFPANFILIAAMNPSRGHDPFAQVDERERLRVEKKISGPIADRIDMWVEVGHVPHRELQGRPQAPRETPLARERIAVARRRQHERLGSKSRTNADMSVRDIDARTGLAEEARRRLEESAAALKLSPRAFHRVIKLARTIADLEASEIVSENHILEALAYRPRGLFA